MLNALILVTALNGTWLSSQGTANLASEQGSIHYENCAVQTTFAYDGHALHIDNVKASCTHANAWAFGQKLPSFDLTVLNDGTVRGPNGMKAGIVTADRLSIRLEQDGIIYFIDANTTAEGIHFEWSQRGFEGVPFDVTAECTRLKSN